MAHVAELNEQNIVTRVIVVDNSITNPEQWAQEFLGGVWKQTSYNAKIRNKFAGIGDTYSEKDDVFIAPSPFDSWILDETTFTWNAPIPKPNDGNRYYWDETTLSWVQIKEEK